MDRPEPTAPKPIDPELIADTAEEHLSRSLDNVIPTQGYHEQAVVGLGGSTGSQAALEKFFRNTPNDTGFAFVIVVHLSPDHESLLPSIITKWTTMPVQQVRGQTPLLPNCVYVIPPGKHLSMMDGKLSLRPLLRERGKRVAVDLFFRTLADCQGPNSVAIVLSGGDSDGSIGIKRVKERGGLTIAQDPIEAENPEMPRSAMATTMVDWILRAEEMPQRLIEFRRNGFRLDLPNEDFIETASSATTSKNELAYNDVLTFLRGRTGRDFGPYKRATVVRRIGRRMQVNGVETLPTYSTFLRSNPGEAGALLQDLLINVTNFFRDPHAFAALEALIPNFFVGRTANQVIRVWVVACATGEEAYSIAILLSEFAAKLSNPPAIQIFATDVDEHAIATARAGIYPASIIADVSDERLRLYFTKQGGYFRVNQSLREMILFAAHDVLKDAPFSRLDLITCRNLLIYLDREAQFKSFDIFNFALALGGFLMLGLSETAEDATELFTVHDKKQRIFRRKEISHRARRGTVALSLSLQVPQRTPGKFAWPAPGAFFSGDDSKTIQVGLSAAELHYRLLEHLGPPSVLIDERNSILHSSAHAGHYLRFGGGMPTTDLLHLVHPMLRVQLRTALFQASQSHARIETAPFVVAMPEGDRGISIIIEPASDAAPGATLVIFKEVTLEATPPRKPLTTESEAVVGSLEKEIETLKHRLREHIEQHGAFAEEMKASNEELHAMNEELRSASEELETSREELQSINEELTTVNTELKNKVDEAGRANSDLQNLMASTAIATVFLDRELLVKRYTPSAIAIFNFIPSDVGRPIAHVTHQLIYPSLAADAEGVLKGSDLIEREVQSANERWFLARLTPYRAAEGEAAGVVLTFVDITANKQDQLALQQSEERFRALVSTNSNIIYRMSADWGQLLELRGADTVEKIEVPSADWVQQLVHPEDRSGLLATIRHSLISKAAFTTEYRLLDRDGKTRWVSSSAVPLLKQNEIREWFGAMTDLTPQRQAEQDLRIAHENTSEILESFGDYFYALDANFRFTYINDKAAQKWGRARADLIGKNIWEVFPEAKQSLGYLRHIEAIEDRQPKHFEELSPVLNVWMSVSIFPRKSKGLLVYFQDISERKKAAQHLQESEVRTLLALTSAQLGTWNWNARTGKFDADVRCRELCGFDAGKIDAKVETLFPVYPADQKLVRAKINEALNPAGDGRFDIEFRCLRADQVVRWLMARGETQFEVVDGNRVPAQMLGTVMDITERKENEFTVRTSEARFRAMFSQTTAGFCCSDLNGKIIFANDRLAEMLGFAMSELVGKNLRDFTHPEEMERVLPLFIKMVEDGENYEVQKRLQRKNGDTIWADVGIAPINDSNGKPTSVVVIILDVTARKKVEAELQETRKDLENRVQKRTAELSHLNNLLRDQIEVRKKAEESRREMQSQLVAAQEAERGRISRELHDEVGQHLTALMLGLKTLENGQGVPATLRGLQALTETIGREIHEVALELRPTSLDDFGLIRALSNFIDEWSRRTHISAGFHYTGFKELRLAPHIETTIYRIVGEALNNVLKHAEAKHVSVILDHRGHEVAAIIEDDGVGFDPEDQAKAGLGKRLGLVGMQERAVLMDGNVTIESSVGNGTTVFVHIPLSPGKTDQASSS